MGWEVGSHLFVRSEIYGACLREGSRVLGLVGKGTASVRIRAVLPTVFRLFLETCLLKESNRP